MRTWTRQDEMSQDAGAMNAELLNWGRGFGLLCIALRCVALRVSMAWHGMAWHRTA